MALLSPGRTLTYSHQLPSVCQVGQFESALEDNNAGREARDTRLLNPIYYAAAYIRLKEIRLTACLVVVIDRLYWTHGSFSLSRGAGRL